MSYPISINLYSLEIKYKSSCKRWNMKETYFYLYYTDTQGVEIEHSIIDTYDLEVENVPLVEYVLANQKALYLLDL